MVVAHCAVLIIHTNGYRKKRYLLWLYAMHKSSLVLYRSYMVSWVLIGLGYMRWRARERERERERTKETAVIAASETAVEAFRMYAYTPLLLYMYYTYKYVPIGTYI